MEMVENGNSIDYIAGVMRLSKRTVASYIPYNNSIVEKIVSSLDERNAVLYID